MQRRARRGGRGSRAPAALTLACAALAVPLAVADEPFPEAGARPAQWSLHDRGEGPAGAYAVYRRELPASDVPAYRLEAILDAPPEAVAAAATRIVVDPEASEPNVEKTVLRNDGEAIVVYAYVRMPLVADRDVITRLERSRDAATGIHRLSWRAIDEGPAPKPGVVRLTQSSGTWEFTPLPGGRTRVVYENHAELGGSIPAWVIEPMMDDSVVQNFVRLFEQVHRDPPVQGDAAPEAEPPSGSRRATSGGS